MGTNISLFVVSFLAVINVYSASAQGALPSALPSEIQDYTSWTAFPDMPVMMSPERCFIPVPASQYVSNKHEAKGPHQDKYLSVYFNPTAKSVARYLRGEKFPPGSIIIKEKRTHDSTVVGGIGVMKKRDAGFDPQIGDWEFMYLDSNNKLSTGNVEAANCKSCHMRTPSTDYVFGNYGSKSLLDAAISMLAKFLGLVVEF
jgi:hypothetical protein